MSRQIITLFFLLLFHNSKSKIVEIECAKSCKCDIFENLRRAVCVGQNLVSFDPEIHYSADILDVSNNSINELRGSIFQEINLTNLKLLNMSHNSLGNNINIDAFNGLKNLKTLDISYNGVGVLLSIWLKDLPRLKEFYVSGNHLETITTIIESKSLEILDLSNCKLLSLDVTVFQNLPNLRYLDISKNILHTIHPDVIKPLKSLTNLNFEDNYNYNCKSGNHQALLKYLTENHIEFQKSCKEKKKVDKTEKFQKMINDKTLEKNSWIFDLDDEPKETPVVKSVQTCMTKEDQFLLRIVKLSPEIILGGIFLYGILVGAVLACTCGNCMTTKKPITKRNENIEMVNRPLSTVRNRTNLPVFDTSNDNFYKARPKTMISTYFKRYQSDADDVFDDLMSSEWNIAQSTPVLPRRTVS